VDDWLKKTRELQIEAYGKDPAELEGADLQFFVIWNALAAVKELSEATDEVRWKPWATLVEGEPVIDKGPFLKEIVDVNHFIANLLVAAGVTDDEYDSAYLEKMETNRERQRRAGGYQSRKGVDKCLTCARSFDDVGRYTDISGAETGFCMKCGQATLGEMKNV
jgi:hypothetical protein